MRNKLFWNTFLVAIIVFLSCMTVTLDALYGYFSSQHIDQLKSQTQLIASAINQYGDDFLDVMILDTNSRVTLIAPDGTVLQDSRTDSSSMENHGNREEVQEALTNGYGQSSRYSDTLSEVVDNYAIRLNNGQILRFSDTQYTVLTLLKTNFHLIIIVLLIAVAVSLILSAKVAQTLTTPLDRIDLSNPSEEDVYPELQPFVRRINIQNRRIAMQMQKTSMGSRAAREYLRMFLSGAVDQDPDKQGRVLIPQMLRDYAGLGDEIVIIGVGTRAEIWNKQAWEDYLTAHEQGYADITSDVLPELEW